MKTTEYTVEEMRSLLENMSGMYDLARVVDPIECRILEIQKDGKINRNKSCYGIWNANHKCINCSSALACRTGCHQEKKEHFNDSVYHIQSTPVRLRLPDGGSYEAVVELVNIDKEARKDPDNINDRAAENINYKAVHYQAHHDNLTKVLNAGSFYELARDKIMKTPNETWVMVTGNIMDFHLINTLFGVLKGNEVLVKTAGLLKTISEKANGLCGRLGGDQFAMLIPNDKYEEKALLNAAQALSYAFNSGIYTFCIHFGVYMIEDAAIPVSVMCGRANSAMRTIRGDLRRTVAYFDDAMLQKSLFEQEIISGFDDALRDGQFRMYLQPLVGENRQIYSAEALVRWIKPDGSIIMPGEFIETLEHAGLIHELDIYIWEQAVKQLSIWKYTKERDITISVNMSAKDFYSVDVYKILTELLEKYDVESRMLRLEITETALLEKPEQSNKIISKLRDKGFIVEIDDFGKGYSSLSILKNIQADILKIDISLLNEIETKTRSRIILESVIKMANSLGMEVVTEGVETETQLKTLSEMGCHLYQGYLFSKPIPVNEFEKLIEFSV